MERVLSNKGKQETKKKELGTNKNWSERRRLSNETIFVLISILVAFLIRLLLIPQDSVINGDGVYYARLGGKIISGDLYGGISAYWSPLYSLLFGFASLFFQDLEFAGRFVSVIAGSVLIIPSYLLIRDFYGRKAAYLGTLLVIIHPFLIKSSGWAMTESVYALIFTTIVLVGSYALRIGGKLNFFLVGVLLGAAYLTKPEAIGFVGLFFVLTIAAKLFRRKFWFRQQLVGYLIILAGFAIFFVPYVLFLYQKTGHWSISEKVMINLPAADYEGGLLQLTEDGQFTMQDKIWGDIYEPKNRQPSKPSLVVPATSAEQSNWKSSLVILASRSLELLTKQVREHIPAILPVPFILFALIGLFFRRWTRRKTAKEIYLFSFVGCTIIGYALTVIELRYLYALIPILLGWVAFGIVGFGNYISKNGLGFLKYKRNINPLWIQSLIFIILVISLEPLFSSQFKPGEWQNVAFEEKQAGLWLKSQTNSSSLIMSSSAVSAFYANANQIYIPDEEFSVVLDYAKRKKVNYLVFSQRRSRNTPKAFPVNEQNLPAELKLVYKDEQHPKYKILIYQLLN